MVRKGDGTGLGAEGYSQVRKGDGTVLWNAIPDNIVDNFNDANVDRPGVYESGETLGDYYRGQTGAFARTSDSIEGSHSITFDQTGTQLMVSLPGDGLNRYPDEGDTMVFLQQYETDVLGGALFNGSIDNGDVSGYVSYVRSTDDELFIQRYDDGDAVTLTRIDVSTDTTEAYWCEFDTPTTSDDSIEFRVYQLDFADDNPQRGDLVGTASANDNTYAEERGVGVARRSGSVTSGRIDWITVDE